MLYQQGTQRIEIIVRKDSSASSIGAKETDTEDVGKQETAQSTTSATPSNDYMQKRFMRVNATHIVATAKQVANLSINYAISGLGNKYGDQALQESVSRQFEIVQDVGNIATSVAMGVTYGAAGGPIGMVIGGVLGLVSSGVSTIFKYKERDREWNYKVFKESNAIEYQRARASINLTTGRLR